MTKATGLPHAATKTAVAIHWLQSHPALSYLSARRLADEVHPAGGDISYKTWAAAKRALKTRTVTVAFKGQAVVLTTKDRRIVKLAGFPLEARQHIHGWALRRGYTVTVEKGGK